MKKLICSTCFHRVKYEKEYFCKLIENEGGGSIEANLTKCSHYLKKGTEPKWICCVCGKNTYGEALTMEGGKYYCQSCWWNKDKQQLKKQTFKQLKNKLIKEFGIDGKDKFDLLEFMYRNPKLRFWQAIRDFAKVNFVLLSTHFEPEMFSDLWRKKHKDFKMFDSFYYKK